MKFQKKSTLQKVERAKRKPAKIVIRFDRIKIVKKVVKKPCQFMLPTELTDNSEDLPGQPKHENHMKIPFEVRLAKQTNQLFYSLKTSGSA